MHRGGGQETVPGSHSQLVAMADLFHPFTSSAKHLVRGGQETTLGQAGSENGTVSFGVSPPRIFLPSPPETSKRPYGGWGTLGLWAQEYRDE